MSSTPKLGRWVRVRIIGVATLLILLLGAIAYRAYGIQIRQRDHYRDLARRQHVATVEIPAPRGAIYDATGTELAVTADIESVYANPREIHDFYGTAEALGAILDLDPAQIEARLDAPRYFVWIARHVTSEDARRVREAKLRGVYLTPEPRRFYPGKEVAGPILGFAGIDGRGLDGLELTMDELLAGKRAKGAALRDASGKLMYADSVVEPQAGASVTLTIDRFVQYTAERVLRESIEEHKAIAGVAVVIDVPTGEVLGMANWPTFDPNMPADARPEGARNRAITDVFEIGSIMKVFSVAAALDAGVISPSTVIDVERGRYRIGRKVIRDTFHDEELDIGGVLKRSSNVGAVKIAQMLGRERLYLEFRDLGFGQRTDIELPGEQPGLIRPPSRWSDIGLATHSFGYGMSVTPLQVTAAMAAVAAGGIYRQPSIIREVRDADGRSLYSAERLERRVLSEETALALRPMLASVFEDGRYGGTARSLDLRGLRAGGKTGTAHKLDPATGTYGDDLYLSSFAGFAPLDDPRIAVLVLIDEPHGEHHYGGSVAGPAWLELTTATLRYLGLPAGSTGAEAEVGETTSDAEAAEPGVVPEGDGTAADDQATVEDEPHGGEIGEGQPAAPAGAENLPRARVPDFTGMGVAEALALAASRGLAVEVVGSGRAVRQFPGPGVVRLPAQCRIVFTHETAAEQRSP